MLEYCLSSQPQEFLLVEYRLFALPSFSRHSCPSLATFPADRSGLVGIVEDETNRTSLIAAGLEWKSHEYNSWWLWRKGSWERTADTTYNRCLSAFI